MMKKINKKIFLFLLFFVLITNIYGETTFPNPIIVKSYNFSFNITTEEGSRIFDCSQNTSVSYIFNLKRNISSYEDISKINSKVDELASACDSFNTKYGDVSKYFELYATCNTEHKLCQKDLQNKDKDLQNKDKDLLELISCKSSYELSQTQLMTITGNVIPIMKMNSSVLLANLTSCSQALVTEGNNKLLWGFAGAIIIGLFWAHQKRKETHITKRSKTPSGLAPR